MGKVIQDSGLILPLNSKALGNFITSLLGQPQQIDREMFGSFDINHSWFINLIELLRQRIERQAEAKAIEFSASIDYSNGETRNLHSIEEFLHFNETRKLTTQGVGFRMTYLVSFPGKQLPEKQEISVHFSTFSRTLRGLKLPFAAISSNTVGSVWYGIRFTERTWGDDIDKIIGSEIEKEFRVFKKVIHYLRLAFMAISSCLSCGIVMLPLLFGLVNSAARKNEILAKFGDRANIPTDDKIDAMLQLLALSPGNEISFVGFFVSIGLAGLMFALTTYIMTRKRPSFIVLSSYDDARKTKLLRKYSWKTFGVVASYVLSIATGILVNFLSKYLF